ncbi:MAG: polysaccharide export protein family [Bacteroidota bacterium]|nr:polysaccharide export protein family [Bacteroidota bacterium]
MWRKKLLIVSLTAAIISIIVSFIVSPQYKATAIVFPARTFSVSKLLIEQNQGAQEDYMDLGDEDDAEKLLQILNSSEIRIRIADKYDLWTNWQIEKQSVYSQHYLKMKWEDMVSFKRTNFVSIKIEVYDYVANRAADIANSIVAYADSVKFKMTREVAEQALAITRDEYNETMHRIKELEDSLQTIKELGVLDTKEEVTAYSRSMAKAIEKGNESAQKKLQEKLDVLKKYGTSYENVHSNLKKYRMKYPIIKNKYDEAMVNYSRPLPSKFVVDKATPNEKKERPIRWLVVLVSTASAFILALLYLLFTERFADFKKKMKLHINSQNVD